MGQQAESGTPMAPETPVTEKIPGHQRRREKTADECRDGKDDVAYKRKSRQNPAIWMKTFAHS